MPEQRLARTRRAYSESPTLHDAAKGLAEIAIARSSTNELLTLLNYLDPALASLARRCATYQCGDAGRPSVRQVNSELR
jgi:hypothetical protein